MKKLKLDSTNFVSGEVLTRAQLKSIQGGTGSGFIGTMYCVNENGFVTNPSGFENVNCDRDQWDFYCKDELNYVQINSYCKISHLST